MKLREGGYGYPLTHIQGECDKFHAHSSIRWPSYVISRTKSVEWLTHWLRLELGGLGLGLEDENFE